MDVKIKVWQDYMKSAPLGVGYSGPSDGVMNDQLKAAVQGLETKLKAAGKSVTILSGTNFNMELSAVQDLVKQIVAQIKPNSLVTQWKEYLKGKGLYTGDMKSLEMDDAFKGGMQALENIITSKVPSVKGMIWQNGQIGPQATISDVEEALKLLTESKKIASTKYGVATLDALGDPTAPDYTANYIQEMFISQEDSKLNEWDPKNDQNQGSVANKIPTKTEPAQNTKQQEINLDIDERMQKLMELMESVKN